MGETFCGANALQTLMLATDSPLREDAHAARYPILDMVDNRIASAGGRFAFCVARRPKYLGPCSLDACELCRALYSQLCTPLRNQLCSELRSQRLCMQRRMNDKDVTRNEHK